MVLWCSVIAGGVQARTAGRTMNIDNKAGSGVRVIFKITRTATSTLMGVPGSTTGETAV